MRFLKTNELIEIYTLHKQGEKDSVIARKLGRSSWGISTAIDALSQYMEGKYPKQPRKAYLKAIQIINRQNGVSIEEKQPSTNGISVKPIEADREADLKTLDTAF